jgi:branched-chain amino acid transport system substrate-binding protein
MSERKRRGRGLWLSAASLAVLAATAAVIAPAATGRSTASPIKIAILSDCKGAFGAFYDSDIGGAIAAFSQLAGAKPKDPNKPSAGMVGGSIGGHPLKIVGFGCSDDSADLAIKETKRLMEQLGADVMIGPLSGAESIAVATYAKAHPTKTFVNGTAGAQETTLKVRAPNFFRFHGDGAQWNAGIGEIAYNKLKWRKVALIEDDYAFAYASAAGMIADFCAVGGKVVKRVAPPLNTTDYSSYVRQLPPPNKVDGYFWVIGGAGTVPSLKAFESVYGPISAKKFIGNLFFATPGSYEQLAPRIDGAYVGGFGNAPDLKTAIPYSKIIGKWFKKFPPFTASAEAQAGNGFVYNYYLNAWGLIGGLKAVKGSLAGGQKKLQQAVFAFGKKGINAGYGRITLDKYRNGIQDQYSYKLIAKTASGAPGVVTIMTVPKVDETWGGHFTPQTPPLGKNYPTCAKFKLPWQGQQRFVNNGRIGAKVGNKWAKLP